MRVWTLLSKQTKDIEVSLSENADGNIELNENRLCVYGTSKGRNSGMTENSNLELSGNDKGDDQKGNICKLPLPLQLPPLLLLPQLLPHYFIYNVEGKFELNEKNIMCIYIIQRSQELILVLSRIFWRILKGQDHLTSW